jgi:putative peptidoglycan lipid II flippase
MRLVFFITVPSMVGLIILREPIVALLFKRGAFDMNTTRMTAVALLYYGIGLWAFSAVRIVVSVYYALQDTRTPVRMAVVSLLVNICLGILLMGPLQHGGLALATSLASMVNYYLLVWGLKKKIGLPAWRDLLISAARTLGCACAMGMVVYGVMTVALRPLDQEFWRQLTGLVTAILAGMLVYAGCAVALKSPEMLTILQGLKKTRK